jgi:hypothetical protein
VSEKIKIKMNFNQLQSEFFASKIFLKRSSPKPKKEISKGRINKAFKKVVKLNLLNILNNAINRPLANKLKHKELIDLRKNKIKEEFHGRNSVSKRRQSEENKENSSPSSTKVSFIEFSSSNEFPTQKPSLRQQLIKFAQKHNPKPEMIDDLINIMKSNGLQIPQNHFNFFDKKFEIIKMNFGSYLNVGVERAIRNYYRPSYIKKPSSHVTSSNDPLDASMRHRSLDTLLLDVAVYIVKSKSCNGLNIPQCMIIFGRINCQVFDDPFIIGVYYGSFPAPTIGNEVMKPFVDEIKLLRERELVVEGNYAFKIKLHAFVTDPISNSLITCTSLPNSLYGCSKCNQRANLQIDEGFTSFPCTMTLATQRSDDDFTFLFNDHHVAQPLLAELEIGLISQFATDYKIVVCMGVMKHLANLWIRGRLDYRLNKETQQKISRDLILMTTNCPREFPKKPRSFEEMSQWDATDWNLFLLYFSPIALKSRMPQRYYVHYLYLHLAMRILMSSELNNAEANSFILGQLLNTFIADFTTLYGGDKVDYNVHNLLHFEQIQQKLGPLKKLQGFVYENQISMFNDFMESRGEEINLEEIGEKVVDNSNNMLENKINELINTNYPFINIRGELVFKKFTISVNEPDNHVITNNAIVKVEAICHDAKSSEIIFIGRRYQKIEIMFQAPLSNQKLFLVADLSQLHTYRIYDIVCKAVKIDNKDGIFIQSLIT